MSHKDLSLCIIDINCYMIPEKDIIDNPNVTGDYNVARYLSVFNKKVEPLLVVFHPDVRDGILITNPQDREFFTKNQCELVNGFPLKEAGQDNYEEVMTLSDSEVLFWNRVNRDPYFMYLDNSLEHVNQDWVKHNREVVKFQKDSVPSKGEDILEPSGRDYATHTSDED